MRKELLILSLIFLFSAFQTEVEAQAKRYPIYEHFTNTGCGPCAQANPIFWAMYEPNRYKAHHISFHPSWPSPNDPMYLHNSSEATAMVNYYGVRGVPAMYMDGSPSPSGSTNPTAYTEALMDSRIAETSPVAIVVSQTVVGNLIRADIKIKVVGNVPSGNYRLRAAAVEQMINYSSAPGSNGERDFPNVFRRFIGNGSGGQSINLVQGQTIDLQFTYSKHSAWSINDIYTLAWIYNSSTKEVLNSGASYDFNVNLSDNSNVVFQEGVPNVYNQFDVQLSNEEGKTKMVEVELTGNAPSGWSAVFVEDGNAYTSKKQYTLFADDQLDISIKVKPGTAIGLGKYTLSVKDFSNSTRQNTIKKFVISGVTDLVTFRSGSPVNIAAPYVNGLANTNNTNHAAMADQYLKQAYEDGALTNVKNIYHSIGWNFPAIPAGTAAILQNFMNEGKNVMTSGQDIGWDVFDANGNSYTSANQYLINEYFRVNYLDDGTSSRTQLIAESGDAVFGNIPTASITRPYGNTYLYPDRVSARNNGHHIFRYNSSSQKAGVRAEVGNRKTVYLGIGLEQVSPINRQYDIVKQAHDWFYNFASNTLDVSATVSQAISCAGSLDGEITITTTGGNGDLAYRMNTNAYQSGNTYSGLGAGTYTFTVKDENGHIKFTNTITLVEPDAIIATTSTLGNEITVHASGGAGNFSYSLDGISFQTNPVFPDLANGNYAITVKDANDCLAVSNVDISGNTLNVDGVTAQDVSCYSLEDGQLTINITGGTPPLEYSLNGATFQSSNTFMDLGPGDYQVKVRDSEFFTLNTNTYPIGEPSMVIADNVVDQDQITVSVTGGVGGFEYSLDGINFQSDPIFSGLANGSYTLTVRDANGCTTTTNALVAVNTLVVSGAVSQEITCFDANDGIITVQVGGGNAPFEYSINGVDFQVSNVFENLSPGTYTFTVRDADGLTRVTDMITLINPLQIQITISLDHNNATGTANGGTGNLQYSLDGSNYHIDGNFDNLSNGDYTLYVKDDKGCIETSDFSVFVNTMIVNLEMTNAISCSDSNDGSITANVSGGTPPFQYALNGGDYVNNHVFENLGSGNYEVSIRDNDGFVSQTNSVNLTAPDPLIALLDINGYDFTVNATGGTPPFQYKLEDGVYQTTNIFTGNPMGDYDISVMDANGCVFSTTASITVVPLGIELVYVDNASCHNSSDGRFEVGPTGGLAPFTYELIGISGPVDSGIYQDLSPGDYQVIITDAGGFTADWTITISAPDPIEATITYAFQAVEINPSGGTPPFEYSLNGGMYSDDPRLNGIVYGDMNLISIRDANDCIKEIILPVDILEMQYTLEHVTCFGLTDGLIAVRGIGGLSNGDYEYSFDGGITYTTDKVFNNLGAGIYEIAVRDQYGVIKVEAIEITQPDVLSAQIHINGQNISITAYGGTPPYQYSLDGGPVQDEYAFENVLPGDHIITVVDMNGCEVDIDVTLSSIINMDLSLDFSLQPNPAVETVMMQLNDDYYGPLDIRVLQMDGKLIKHIQVEKNARLLAQTIELDGLSSGQYLVHIEEGGEKGGRKVLVVGSW